jgi:general secretion pathway protein J
MVTRAPKARRGGGFTLIELLVAISLMALMAALSWRGLDGMTRSQTQMRQHADEVLALQAGLAQWGADLDALAPQPNSPSLDWDGRALRILRRDTATPGAGLHVVAWSRRSVDGAGQWLRWQSPPLRTRGELQQAWQNAASWAQNPGAQDRLREVRIAPLDQWQIFFYRGGAWSNPLSSAGTTGDGKPAATAAAAPALPDAVRLVLSLSAGQALGGSITRDWLRPTVGGGK